MELSNMVTRWSSDSPEVCLIRIVSPARERQHVNIGDWSKWVIIENLTGYLEHTAC